MRRVIQLFTLFSLLITTGFGCNLQSAAVVQASKPVQLVWWRVFDDADTVSSIIEAYRKVHPNITITYRKLRPEEYEKELLNALAEDRGPDIISVHNTAMMKWQPKLLPLPPELKLAYQVEKGTIQKQVVTEIHTDKTIRLDQLKNTFVDQVAADAILPFADAKGVLTDQIFGLPLGLDTLVLYWNRDLLNAANIAEPARTWDEFLTHVQTLTKFDAKGGILEAGAAIGTADNVERSVDILSGLMMQNGAVMRQGNQATFDVIPAGLSRETAPGSEALRFYTDFANPGKKAYTWNDQMPDSLTAFTSGAAAYFFGYAYNLPVIRTLNPKLSFGIASLPQIDPTHVVNVANYWLESVSAKTKHPNEAWDFVQFATKAGNVDSYLKKAGKPTAVRSLVAGQLEDLSLSVFAGESLTAKSWYVGKDPDAGEATMNGLIRSVIAGSLIEEAIHVAAGTVSQTMQ